MFDRVLAEFQYILPVNYSINMAKLLKWFTGSCQKTINNDRNELLFCCGVFLHLWLCGYSEDTYKPIIENFKGRVNADHYWGNPLAISRLPSVVMGKECHWTSISWLSALFKANCFIAIRRRLEANDSVRLSQLNSLYSMHWTLFVLTRLSLIWRITPPELPNTDAACFPWVGWTYYEGIPALLVRYCQTTS